MEVGRQKEGVEVDRKRGSGCRQKERGCRGRQEWR